MTQEEWESAQWQRAHSVKNLRQLREVAGPGLSEAFLADLARSRRLLVVEEHVAQGGVAQMIAAALLAAGRSPDRFATRSAQGYLSGRYGSQKFHRRECQLDPESVVRFLTSEDA